MTDDARIDNDGFGVTGYGEMQFRGTFSAALAHMMVYMKKIQELRAHVAAANERLEVVEEHNLAWKERAEKAEHQRDEARAACAAWNIAARRLDDWLLELVKAPGVDCPDEIYVPFNRLLEDAPNPGQPLLDELARLRAEIERLSMLVVNEREDAKEASNG
jgi:hypothetical protein